VRIIKIINSGKETLEQGLDLTIIKDSFLLQQKKIFSKNALNVILNNAIDHMLPKPPFNNIIRLIIIVD